MDRFGEFPEGALAIVLLFRGAFSSCCCLPLRRAEAGCQGSAKCSHARCFPSRRGNYYMNNVCLELYFWQFL